MMKEHLVWHFRLCNKRGFNGLVILELLITTFFYEGEENKMAADGTALRESRKHLYSVRGEERRSEILWRAWLRLYGP